MAKSLTAAQATTTALRLLNHFTSYDGAITVSSLKVFLIVHKQEGTDGALVRDLVRVTGLRQSTIARLIAYLGNQPARGKRQEGLGLLVQHADPDDPRRVRVFTTQKGKRFAEEIANLLG